MEYLSAVFARWIRAFEPIKRVDIEKLSRLVEAGIVSKEEARRVLNGEDIKLAL